MQFFSLNTGYRRRSAWINPTLFLCTVTFVIVFGLFIGYSVHYGFFDYVIRNVVIDTHGATPLREKTDGGLAFPCTLNGCNVSGNLGENDYSFYYVSTGSQGMGYVYRVVGNDVRHFNVVTSANGQLPSYPRDSHVQPISDTEIEVLQYVGSCRPNILFFGIVPGPGHAGTYSLLIKGYVLENSGTCDLMDMNYLICILIGVGGGVAWIIFAIIWFVYSWKIRARVALDRSLDEQNLLPKK